MVEKRADTSVDVAPMIAARWSPRALDPTAEVTDAQLRALLEAARWAPSYGNTQPARYLIGRRGDDTFDRIFGVLSAIGSGYIRAGAGITGYPFQ